MVKKNIMMVMPVMKGGGAERVAAQLMNEFHRKGHDVSFLLTSSCADEVIRTDLDSQIPLILLQEELNCKKEDCVAILSRKLASLFCRLYEMAGKSVPAGLARWSFMSQYGKEVEGLHEIMKAEPDLTVITFLQPSIPMVALASQGLPNKTIFSERGNPERLMKHRYGRNFIEKYYTQFSHSVFQTDNARDSYPEETGNKSVVIANPLKLDLPMPYEGERNKTITTYCRISKQKNLPMLLKAFAKLHEVHPECNLKIIGDILNEEGQIVLVELHRLVNDYKLNDKVAFEPFSKQVHKKILQDAMYVNSSDYEGMSNAMLESLAIGLPVICTDCPTGGARAVIQDGKNGLLVPVGDEQALYEAMKQIIENKELANKLSNNGSKIRDLLSLENIAEKWLELM